MVVKPSMDEVSRYVTTADWNNISRFLFPLWGLVFAAFGFAGSMLLAHGVIPSLSDTRELPDPRMARLRPPLYLVAIAFLALGAFMVVLLVTRLEVVGDVFPRWLV